MSSTGAGWRCAISGCSTVGAWNFPIPPMTPKEAWDRHIRTGHPKPRIRTDLTKDI